MVGNDVPRHGRCALEVLAGLAERQAAGPCDTVISLDVVSNRALVVVVMNASARQLRTKCSNFSHRLALLKRWAETNRNQVARRIGYAQVLC